ncbi:hypothetical protein CYMTET_34518 [Cymbomonas tetramitiformis]|uniref:Uncharacterized protein n=1 Tax=Cymbomonas tetramitiformis TaxID=36881 RepID=A0AAE0KQ39_9CHLO|nr:hypothetical protein CYMTET_34518 [Cymbomonas tetramitiformis]
MAWARLRGGLEHADESCERAEEEQHKLAELYFSDFEAAYAQVADQWWRQQTQLQVRREQVASLSRELGPAVELCDYEAVEEIKLQLERHRKALKEREESAGALLKRAHAMDCRAFHDTCVLLGRPHPREDINQSVMEEVKRHYERHAGGRALTQPDDAELRVLLIPLFHAAEYGGGSLGTTPAGAPSQGADNVVLVETEADCESPGLTEEDSDSALSVVVQPQHTIPPGWETESVSSDESLESPHESDVFAVTQIGQAVEQE